MRYFHSVAAHHLCRVASTIFAGSDKNMSVGKGWSSVGILIVLLLGFGFGSIELNGQIGGFIKKRAKEIMQPDSGKKDETTSQQSDNQTPRFNENVLELNAENVARLEKALTCEKEFRAGVEAKYAKLPGKEQYQNCLFQVQISPESQALAEGLGNNADMKKVQQIGEKILALQEQKCGKDPEKLRSNKGQELRPSREEGAKCAGLTLRQYTIAMERIAPFCNSGGQAKVRSYGELYYVYTPTEMSAIQPKCTRLTGLISDLSEPAKTKK